MEKLLATIKTQMYRPGDLVVETYREFRNLAQAKPRNQESVEDTARRLSGDDDEQFEAACREIRAIGGNALKTPDARAGYIAFTHPEFLPPNEATLWQASGRGDTAGILILHFGSTFQPVLCFLTRELPGPADDADP